MNEALADFLARLVMIEIAFVVYRMATTAGVGFLAWLFLRSVYFHPSHWVDIKLFVFGRLFGALGLVNRLAISTLVGAAVIATLANSFGPRSSRRNSMLLRWRR